MRWEKQITNGWRPLRIFKGEWRSFFVVHNLAMSAIYQ
jgi:hypothetical protein